MLPLKENLIKIEQYASLIEFLKCLFPISEATNLNDMIKRGGFLENSQDYDAAFKLFSKVLSLDPKSQEAHHYLGRIFESEGFLKQSYLMFSEGLKLKKSEYLKGDIHRRFHFDLSDLCLGLHRTKPKSKLSEFGFPTETLGFQFSNKYGFYLPNFDYNRSNGYFQEVGMQKGKERALGHIHYHLGILENVANEPHSVDNCPYLKYFNN